MCLPLDKDKVIEYDKEGRLHYVPKSVARSASYDRYGEGGSGLGVSMKSTGTLTEDSDFDDAVSPHGRNNSVGTNILYKIRREELAKGAQPTVKSLARAFESLDPGEKGGTLRNFKRGLFSIRKSRSVDTNDGSKDGKVRSSSKVATEFRILVPDSFRIQRKKAKKNLTFRSLFVRRQTLPTESSYSKFRWLSLLEFEKGRYSATISLPNSKKDHFRVVAGLQVVRNMEQC